MMSSANTYPSVQVNRAIRNDSFVLSQNSKLFGKIGGSFENIKRISVCILIFQNKYTVKSF
jgi:hypothetical protein